MKRIILLAATVACMAACQNNNSNKVPAIDLNNFDLSVAPNADFYQYATGGWQKNNPLKPEFSRYGSFDVLRENNEKRINELFQAMAKTEAVKGSVEQKISDLYKMGLDSVRLNAEGAAPLEADLQMVEGLTDRAQLPDLLARIHMALGNPFFGIGVMADLMDSNVNTLYVGQSGISMGDRDYYVAPENAKIKEAYKAYLVKLFTLCGYETEAAATAAADALEIEDSLAEVFFSNVEQRDIPAQYNPMTREEFARTYDALDWDVYFKGMGLEQVDRLIVEQKRVMARVNEMLKTLPLEKIRHYLAAQIINGGASSLSDDFQTASFEFYGRTMSGQQEQKPRWKRAMSVPNGLLGEAVGEMYVAKYFPEKDKQRMTQLVKNLQTSLSQHIAALDWMSDATKAKAQEKLAAFTVKIGYPDKWKDYSTLEIDPAKSYYENLRDASIWATKDNLSKYGKPVDRAEWGMTPQTVNAYYNPTTN